MDLTTRIAEALADAAAFDGVAEAERNTEGRHRCPQCPGCNAPYHVCPCCGNHVYH